MAGDGNANAVEMMIFIIPDLAPFILVAPCFAYVVKKSVPRDYGSGRII